MKTSKLPIFSIILAIIFLAACKDNEIASEKQVGAYTLVGSSTEASYVLQSNQLDSGALTIENQGIEAATATVWWFYNNKYLYRLVYNQGNAGTGSSFAVDSTGTVYKRNMSFEITSRFTTYGNYEDHIVTAAAGATAQTDDAGNAQYGVTFTLLNVEDQSLTTKTISTENFLGTGEYVTFSGIEESNGKIYTAVCPIGYSAYGVAKGYASATSTTTAYPDSVWIAVYDNLNFENPTIIRDNRLSYATSRYHSQYYSNIATDDNENIYVFSSAYPPNTTKKSGVLRINKGETKFDPDFYIDIEALSGGIHMFKTWHVSGNYFALQMYTDSGAVSAVADYRKMAILNVADKTLRWVTGLPDLDVLGSFAKTAYVENGKFYMPVVTTDGAVPAVYIINPVTATAQKGISVTATTLDAVGKLVYN